VIYPACETRTPVRKKDRILVDMSAKVMLSLQVRNSIATAKYEHMPLTDDQLYFIIS